MQLFIFSITFSEKINKQGVIDNYGNWCGYGHGGFSDCCGGTSCPACDSIINDKLTTMTQECLDQCKPIDGIDHQCAFHDLCCSYYYLANPDQCENAVYINGNNCMCDVILVHGVRQYFGCSNWPPMSGDCSSLTTYASNLQSYFIDYAACYIYISSDNKYLSPISKTGYNFFCNGGTSTYCYQLWSSDTLAWNSCNSHQYYNVLGNCNCNLYYYGTDCSRYCESSSTCNSKGNCDNDGYCICYTYYYKTDCSIYCDEYTTCNSHGSCDKNGNCECINYYYGDTCLIHCKDGETCIQGDCDINGKCICYNTWYGEDCDVNCDSQTCNNNGNCNENGTCKCDTSWFGQECSIYCDDEKTCNSHGSCNDGKCKCITDWYGDDCNSKVNYCGEHGTYNDIKCICEKNWYGTNCTIFCDEVKTCNSHGNCDNDGKCKCSEGWEGDNCKKKEKHNNLILYISIPAGATLIIILGIITTILVLKFKKNKYQNIEITEKFNLESVS